MVDEIAWYKDPMVLARPDRAMRFFPTASMTVHSQLNSVMRFVVYYSVILVLATGNFRYTLFIALGAILSAMVGELAFKDKKHRANDDGGLHEPWFMPGKEACTRPTLDNPHMNFNLFDARDRAPACKPWNEDAVAVAGEPRMDSPFQKRVDRFYTMPCTTATNDQKGFAEWLYGSMPGKGNA